MLGSVNLAKYQLDSKKVSNVSVSLFDILEHLGHFTFNQSLSFNKGFPFLLKSILIGNLTGRSFVGTGCAPQFLQCTVHDNLYKDALSTLAARGLVSAVTGESVMQMMKFSHQIITESAYNIMLDSQRREVHKAIAIEYEKSTGKFSPSF